MRNTSEYATITCIIEHESQKIRVRAISRDDLHFVQSSPCCTVLVFDYYPSCPVGRFFTMSSAHYSLLRDLCILQCFTPDATQTLAASFVHPSLQCCVTEIRVCTEVAGRVLAWYILTARFEACIISLRGRIKDGVSKSPRSRRSPPKFTDLW